MIKIKQCDCCANFCDKSSLIEFKFTRLPMFICPECLKGMTNGDMIKTIFPNIQTRNEDTDFMTYTLDGIVGTCVETKWWNAPYERS